MNNEPKAKNNEVAVTLESWIEFMKSTPDGLHEGLESFLLKNPDQFRVDENIGHGASPAALQRFSNMMTKINKQKPISSFAVDLALKGVGQDFVNNLRSYLVAPKVPLKEWVEIMDKSENGFNPTLKEFILKNPDLYNPSRNEGEGVTPRSLTLASMVLSQQKQGMLTALTLQDLLGDDGFQRFTQHLQNKVEYYNDLIEKMSPKKKTQENTLDR